MQARILLMGLGNLLLGDEGLGVQALQRLLKRYRLPPEIEAIDGGVMGLELVNYFEGVDDLLVIDAVRAGKAPGELVRLEGDDIPAMLAVKLSMHQVGLQEVLGVAELMGTMPRRLVVWGIEPQLLTPGVELSPAVEHQLDALVEAVAGELRGWGAELGRA